MADIKAGVVVVTRFCNAGTKAFGKYVDYIDREEAKRQEHLSEYNLYNDYMDNPEKTTGLFSKDKIELTPNEKKELKKVFKVAQEKGSLMWQTVISFDNRWLSQFGLYDEKNKIVDERKLKELATGAVERMLKNEGLENAVWSAAIHYNTDNVHIHVATVEPVPLREKKEYVQYEDILVKGKKEKIPMKDKDGNEIKKSEYVGVFKGKSIEMCKKHMVDNIINQKEQNIVINRIIRDNIIKQKKNNPLVKDPELKSKFIELHANMPRKGNRGLWNYNNNIMDNLRPSIDEISDMYIDKYNKEDFNELKSILKKQTELYHTAYGKDSPRDFEKSKMEELYSRMGNAILKEIREYDKQVVISEEEKIHTEEENYFYENSNNSESDTDEKNLEGRDLPEEDWKELQEDYDEVFHQEVGTEVEYGIGNSDLKYFCKWSKKYKEAKRLIFKIGANEQELQDAFELLQDEAKMGNALAIYDLGDIYKFGRGKKINIELSNKYFEKSLKEFCNIYKSKSTVKKTSGSFDIRSYLEYRIGKQYYMGLGTENDYIKAREWFENAVENNNNFASFSLGNIYYYGLETEQDFNRARILYEKANTPFSNYKLGDIYSKGQGMEKPDIKKSEEYYKQAFNSFLSLNEKKPNDNIQYRIGSMLLNGVGTKKDIESAKCYLQSAAKVGNSHAQFKLATLLLDTGQKDEILTAITMLENLAENGNNGMAQYALGKIHLDESSHCFDEEKAIYWLEKASEKEQNNEYAQYTLGKFYLNNKGDEEKAEIFLEKAAKQNNEYAQYTLGKFYLNNKGDEEKAEIFLEKAAKQNNEYAQYTLGKFYLNTKKNEEKAVKWLSNAVEQGNQYAELLLGKFYLIRESAFYDCKKGVAFLENIALQGNQYAQYSLAKEYLKEDSPIFDPREGIMWMEESANQNNQYAQLSLGLIYLKGDYTSRNIVEAKKWIGLSAEQGNHIAKNILENIENYKYGYKPKLYIKRGKQVAFELEKALNAIKKSLKNELQNEKNRNLKEYEKLHDMKLEQEKERVL